MRPQVYAAGAGRRPPELAGRDEVLQRWALNLRGARETGRVPRDAVLTGPSGTGRSVLLARMLQDAAADDYRVVRLTGAPGRWTRDALAPALAPLGVRLGLLADDEVPAFADDLGRLSTVLAEVLADLAAGEGADGRGLVLGVDGLDRLDPEEVEHLADGVALMDTRPGAQVLLVGTGGPETWHRLRGRPGEPPVNTAPEKWFEITPLAGLTPDEVARAVLVPAERAGTTWDAEAVRLLVETTGGHPGLVQFCAAEAWGRGAGSEPVTVDHLREGLRRVVPPSDYGSLRPPSGPAAS